MQAKKTNTELKSKNAELEVEVQQMWDNLDDSKS